MPGVSMTFRGMYANGFPIYIPERTTAPAPQPIPPDLNRVRLREGDLAAVRGVAAGEGGALAVRQARPARSRTHHLPFRRRRHSPPMPPRSNRLMPCGSKSNNCGGKFSNCETTCSSVRAHRPEAHYAGGLVARSVHLSRDQLSK